MKALIFDDFFDVFATLVDRRSGVAREAERVVWRLGYTLDR